MKRKYLLFISLALVIHLLLMLGYQALMSESALYKSDPVLQSIHEETEVLIVGHSHAMSLETNYWPHAHNMAGVGEFLHQSYYKLHYAIEEMGVRPKTVIFPLDLGATRPRNPDRQNYPSYWNRYEKHLELARFSEHPIDFWAYRLAGGMLPYKDGLHDFIDFLFADTLKQGEAMRLAGKQDINQQPDTLRRNYPDACLDKEFSAYGMHYLRSTLALSARHGIDLVFVRFPVTRGFYYRESSCYDPEVYYKMLSDSLTEWQGAYRVLDYHDTFADSLFRDPHHLEAGQVRQRFTEMVRSALVRKDEAMQD